MLIQLQLQHSSEPSVLEAGNGEQTLEVQDGAIDRKISKELRPKKLNWKRILMILPGTGPLVLTALVLCAISVPHIVPKVFFLDVTRMPEFISKVKGVVARSAVWSPRFGDA